MNQITYDCQELTAQLGKDKGRQAAQFYFVSNDLRCVFESDDSVDQVPVRSRCS